MSATPPPQNALPDVVRDVAQRAKSAAALGKVARYIPELADVDPNRFGIAVVPFEGEVVSAGDADVPFSIQSISKVFSLTLALERIGAALWQRVGREPSGAAFNSIVQLEHERGIPRNPFINPGAIVVADVLLEKRTPAETVARLVGLCRRLAGDETLDVDERVAQSERRTGERNRALAFFMAAEGNLRNPVEDVLAVYFSQCAIAMSCRQLAHAGRYLCATGALVEGQPAPITPDRARRICALMMTCGLYDASGEFAFRVGIPAKSGVGGGILAIVPGVASIAVWSPGLDETGSSLRGTKALEDLVGAMGWSVFGPLVAA